MTPALRIGISVLLSYVIGSINFAVIFSKIFSNTDVREHGSGNAGTTNVMRVSGPVAGVLTFVFDFAKGSAAVLLSKFILSGAEITYEVQLLFISAIFCMLGHAFPLFFGFKGGKCVATAIGTILVLDWKVAVIAVAVYLILMIFTKIVSLSTLSAALSAVIVMFIFRYDDVISCLLVAVMCLIVFLRHIPNIKRLIKGEEKKLKIKK